MHILLFDIRYNYNNNYPNFFLILAISMSINDNFVYFDSISLSIGPVLNFEEEIAYNEYIYEG